MKYLSLLLALWINVAGAAEPPTLAHNPFSRPSSVVSTPIREQTIYEGSSREFDLRATMVMPNSRLANVAGRTLRPGDEIQGYTLLQVFEDRAVFASDGKRLTVYVKPDSDDDDE